MLTAARLLPQANAAVDDMAAFAETTSKAMAAVRGNATSRIPVEERKWAQELFHSVAVSDLAGPGRTWQDLAGLGVRCMRELSGACGL